MAVVLKTLIVWLCLTQPYAIDGDTFRVCGVSIRLDDYDAPELFHPQCVHEYEIARRAKDELVRRLSFLHYSLVPCATSNYGRLCAHVPGLAYTMISRGLAVPYPPGHGSWCNHSNR